MRENAQRIFQTFSVFAFEHIAPCDEKFAIRLIKALKQRDARRFDVWKDQSGIAPGESRELSGNALSETLFLPRGELRARFCGDPDAFVQRDVREPLDLIGEESSARVDR